MEKKIKHRILGIVVLIGLVIIVLPFFQGEKELPPQTAAIKPPPFPDQSVQVTSITPIQTSVPKDQPAVSLKQDSKQPAAQEQQKEVNQQPDDIIRAIHPSVVSNKIPANARPKAGLTKTFRTPSDENNSVKFKNAVWVIQMGSFKNKTNALRLVNQLRANGYRAFIQQVTTALGGNTRVFVGPESKRTLAQNLALRLESDMHIRGVIINYKPLAL